MQLKHLNFPDNFYIENFDTGLMSSINEDKFILILKDKQFVIPYETKIILELLKENDNNTVGLVNELSSTYKIKTSLKDIESLVNKLLICINEQSKNPFLFSFPIISETIVNSLALIFKNLFKKWFFLIAIFSFAIIHLFTIVEAFNFFSEVSYTQTISLKAVLIFFISILFHELGHASALLSAGEKPGYIGAGLYFVFPVLFADVTKAWRLKSSQRVIVDLGGLYFQILFLIVLDIYIIYSGDSLLYISVWLITYSMLHTLNPVFKFDGYWLLVDLSGLTNLHARMGSLTISLLKRNTSLHEMSNGQKWLFFTYYIFASLYFIYIFLFIIYSLPITLDAISTNYEILSNSKKLFFSLLSLMGSIFWLILQLFVVSLFLKKFVSLINSAYFKK